MREDSLQTHRPSSIFSGILYEEKNFFAHLPLANGKVIGRVKIFRPLAACQWKVSGEIKCSLSKSN
jgi:hypothetical protein